MIQKIHKTFADPNETDFDPETLKSIIARLDGIEKKLESIIFVNAQVDSLTAVHINGLIGRQFLAQPAAATAPALAEEPMVQDDMVDEIQLEMEEDENDDLIGEFIEQDELKLVEFPINRVDDLRELEESITSDQESFVSFVSGLWWF